MYQTISRNDFHDAFIRMGRKENFSYEARNALFDHIEEMENNNQPIELDVIALCCDYYEDSIENVLKEYSLDSLEDLEQETLVIWHDDENVLYLAY